MNIVEDVILGAVQGLTEFIPVSSSGHLVLLQHFMSNNKIDHLFLEAVNLGTTLALLVFFRVKILKIVKDVLVNKKFVLARNIIITSIPAGAIGFIFAGVIASSNLLNSFITVLLGLFLVGVLMIVLEKLPKAKEVKKLDDMTVNQSLIIGLAQVCAFVPGVSRSGSTIIASRLTGLSNRNAAEYSFLASIPIMIAVTARVFLKDWSYVVDNFWQVTIGNLAAFIFGIIAIKYLLEYLSKHGLAVFGWYRVALSIGVGVIVLFYSVVN